MSPGNAEHAARLLRTVLRSAWYEGLLDAEPMKRPLRYPKRQRKLVVWSVDEVVRAMEAIRGDELEALFLVMVGAGLRREEAIALTWEDVAFGDGIARVNVDKAVTRYGEKGAKNEYSVRTVSIAEPFVSRLTELRTEGHICKSRVSDRMSVERIPRHWKSLFNGGKPLHGLPYIPLSRLRHTHETLMHQAQVPDTTISQTHGHAELKTDYAHYIASSNAAADYAARELEKLFR